MSRSAKSKFIAPRIGRSATLLEALADRRPKRRPSMPLELPDEVTRETSAIEVRPCLTFSRPSSRRRRMPWRTATSAMRSADARSMASVRISSVTVMTS